LTLPSRRASATARALPKPRLATAAAFRSWWTRAAGVVGAGLRAGCARRRRGHAHPGPRVLIEAWETEQGLPGNSATAMVQTPDGYLWFGTFNGLVRFDGIGFSVFDRSNTPELPSPGIVNLHLDRSGRDGLPTVECTMGHQPTAAKGRNGRLWFATLKGVVLVDPARLRVNERPPDVVIRDVFVDGARLAGTSAFATTASTTPLSIEVPPGAKRLEIHYAGLSFTAPEKVRYRHVLEGLDREFADVGDRRVAYLQDLKPGPYRFRVTAANNDGLWSQSAASLDMIQQPHVYETRWFQGRGVALLPFRRRRASPAHPPPAQPRVTARAGGRSAHPGPHGRDRGARSCRGGAARLQRPAGGAGRRPHDAAARGGAEVPQHLRELGGGHLPVDQKTLSHRQPSTRPHARIRFSRRAHRRHHGHRA
jgi:hypothetical protein